MKKISILVFSLFIIWSCNKTTTHAEIEANGIVKDYTGKLDGCGVMIELTNGKRLEIHSLPPGIILIDGRNVNIKYKLTEGAFSICMAGEIVDITGFRYL